MPGTYTLGVRSTPNQTDSDMTFFQIVRSRENHKWDLKDMYGRLIDFQGQISKLSYFNLLDLSDFLMHHLFPVTFFNVAILGVR